MLKFYECGDCIYINPDNIVAIKKVLKMFGKIDYKYKIYCKKSPHGFGGTRTLVTTDEENVREIKKYIEEH